MINRKIFYEKYKEQFGKLKQSQVDGLNFLLQKLDDSNLLNRVNEYSYILATCAHETAWTYQPVTEYGSEKYLKSKKYYPYIGRGFVQLTWKWNYQKYSKELGIDLVGNPDLAKDPETAWKILEHGMLTGGFTGKKLGDYFSDTTTNYVAARKIINGIDQARVIGGYAVKFSNCIKFE